MSAKDKKVCVITIGTEKKLGRRGEEEQLNGKEERNYKNKSTCEMG